MKKSIGMLKDCSRIDKLIVHTFESNVYSASVIIDGEEYAICKDNGDYLIARSVIEIQNLCAPLRISTQVLRQESAYDEMIGGPEKAEGNRMEVSLGYNDL